VLTVPFISALPLVEQEVAVEPASSENDVVAEFTTDELKAGIDQFCQIKLGIPMMDFVKRVRAGEKFSDKDTQDVADLVGIVDRRLAEEHRKEQEAKNLDEE